MLAEADRLLDEAEKAHKTALPTYEAKIKQADQRVQNAEAALQWLKAQAASL